MDTKTRSKIGLLVGLFFSVSSFGFEVQLECPQNLAVGLTAASAHFSEHCSIKNTSPSTIRVTAIRFNDPTCSWRENISAENKFYVKAGEKRSLNVQCSGLPSGPFQKTLQVRMKNSESSAIAPATISGAVKSTQTLESECTPFRLDSPGEVMEYVPAHQQMLGNCFCHTTTQIYDAWRFKNGDLRSNLSASPIDCTRTYYRAQEETDFNAGSNSSAVSKLMTQFIDVQGPCAVDNQRKKLLVIEAQERFLSDATDSLQNIQSSYERINTDRFKAKYAVLKRVNSALVTVAKNSHLESASPISMQAASELITNKNSRLFLENRTPQTCPLEKRFAISSAKPQIKLEGLNGQVRLEYPFVAHPEQDKLLAEIHTFYDAHPVRAMPAAISFCSNVLTDSLSEDKCGMHAAVIAGRRFNHKTKQCQLLIRNSWGVKCSDLDYESQWECENGKGNVWIDSQALSSSLASINLFE